GDDRHFADARGRAGGLDLRHKALAALAGAGDALRPAEKEYITVAEGEGMPGGEVAAGEVGGGDAGQAAALKTEGHKHAGRAVAAQKLHALRAALRGAEENAVHVAGKRGGDGADFLLAVFLAV